MDGHLELTHTGGWEVYEQDPVTGRTVLICVDGDDLHYKIVYPADRLVEQNKAFRDESQNKRFGDWERVASVPLNLAFEKLVQPHTEGDEKHLSKWLNDPDNRAFRTFRGRV